MEFGLQSDKLISCLWCIIPLSKWFNQSNEADIEPFATKKR